MKILTNKSFLNNKNSFLLPTALLIFFFLIFNPWNSWFQLYDDHDITEVLLYFKETNFSEILNTFINRDFNIIGRLRITYLIERILKIIFYGMNYELWSIHSIFISIVSVFIFTLSFLKKEYSKPAILIGSFFMYFGYQVSAWFRFSTSEPIGNLFLAITLLCIICDFYKKNIFSFLLTLFMIIIISFAKESYLLALPWLAFIKFSFDENNNIFEYIRREKVLLISIALVFISNIFIVFKILANTTSGYSESYAYIDFKSIFLSLRDLYRFGYLGILYIALLSMIVLKENKSLIFKFLFPVILITFPQIYIHNTSGFHERYLYPLIFSYSVSIVIFLDKIYKENNNIFKIYINAFNKLGKLFYLSSLIGVFVLSLQFKLFSYNILFFISIFLSAYVSFLVFLNFLKSKEIFYSKRIKHFFVNILITLIIYSITISLGHSIYAINEFKYQGKTLKGFLENNLSFCNKEKNILMLTDPYYHHAWAASVNSFMKYLGNCYPDNLYIGKVPSDNKDDFARFLYDSITERYPEPNIYSTKYEKIIFPIYADINQINDKLRLIDHNINDYDEENIKNFVYRCFILKENP